MNAPFKLGAGGGRDMFQAYACDDNSVSIIRAVAVEMGWEAERVYKGGLRNAVQSLSVSASPQILFVDMSESIDPLTDINGLAEVCEPGTIVIACGQVNDVRLYRDLVASGIQDYLLKPLNTDHLRDALATAQASFSRLATMRAKAAPMSPPPSSACAAASAHRLSRHRSHGCSRRRPTARPRCSISICTSARARWRSISNQAGA